jgi:two-component system sensor histidine kinase KdpD
MSLVFEAPRSPARRPAAELGYAAAVALVALAAGAALLLDAAFGPIPNLSLVFVPPVVVAAVSFGAGPSLLAAALSALAYNFFLIAPRHTLRVADPANVLALVLLLGVAALVSAVAAQSRRRALAALEGAEQAAALRALARGLMGERSRQGIGQRCAEALRRIFQAPACVLLADGERLDVAACGGEPPTAADLEAARWTMASQLATRGGAYPATEARFDFWPLQTPLRQQAAIGVALSGGDPGRPESPERLVETVMGYLAVALDREAYAREATANEVTVAGEKLKAELLAAVSHDLKTPLATILFTLQSLQKFADAHDAAARQALLAGAEAEARRLMAMVENLLDMNRLEAGALSVRPEPTDAADLVPVALARAQDALGERQVVNRIAPGLTLRVDAGLFETALANVLANAGKYAPDAQPIELTGGRGGGCGWIEVADRGPGFGEDPERLFAKFARGVAGDGRAPGTGLGLALARGFLRAMGGDVTAANRPGGGAVVRLSAPLAAPP